MVVVTSTGGTKKLPRPAKLPSLTETYANAGIGVTGGLPHDWTAVRGKDFLQLTSHDGKAVIVIGAQPVPPGTTPPLLRVGLAAVRKAYGRYGRVVIKHAPGQRLGGLSARSVVAYATNSHHVPIRALIAAAQSKNLAYLLEAFTSRSATLHDLEETQEVVLDLRLRG